MENNYSISNFLFQKFIRFRVKIQKNKKLIKGGIIIEDNEEIQKALVPTNDFVFKRIFGRKGNEDITKGLIKSILKQEINELSLDENTILEKDFQDDKIGILDIKAKINNSDIVNIEMQVIKYSNIQKRIMFYWSKLYTDEIKSGDDYNNLKKTIVILIADFELDVAKDIPKYLTKWQIREEDYSTNILTDMLQINIIELPKLIKALEKNEIDKKDKLTLWTTFIISPEKIGEKVMEENKDIKKAKEELEKLKQDKTAKELARLRMKHIMDQKAIQEYGYDEGRKTGISEGRQDEKIKIAKKLLKMNLSIELITESTGLTKEEVEKLNN